LDAALTVLIVEKPDRAIVLKYKRTGRLQNSAAWRTLSATISVRYRLYLRGHDGGKTRFGASDLITLLFIPVLACSP
jgi:hypothetical protein